MASASSWTSWRISVRAVRLVVAIWRTVEEHPGRHCAVIDVLERTVQALDPSEGVEGLQLEGVGDLVRSGAMELQRPWILVEILNGPETLVLGELSIRNTLEVDLGVRH